MATEKRKNRGQRRSGFVRRRDDAQESTGGGADIDTGRDAYRPRPSGAQDEVDKLKKENAHLKEQIVAMTDEHSRELEALITRHNQQLIAGLKGAAQRRAEKIAASNGGPGRGRGLGLPPMTPKPKPVK